MVKTTVYLPDELKASLERLAAEENRSEAELIREAIRILVEQRGRPRPRVPLVDRPLGDPEVGILRRAQRQAALEPDEALKLGIEETRAHRER